MKIEGASQLQNSIVSTTERVKNAGKDEKTEFFYNISINLLKGGGRQIHNITTLIMIINL